LKSAAGEAAVSLRHKLKATSFSCIDNFFKTALKTVLMSGVVIEPKGITLVFPLN